MAIANFAVGFKGDGKTRVIASDSNSLDITGDLTVEAGVFPIATSHSVVIANKDNPWGCALQSNILKAAIKTAQWDWHGGSEVPLKKWTFVTVTFGKKEHHTFVNGKYEDSRAN